MALHGLQADRRPTHLQKVSPAPSEGSGAARPQRGVGEASRTGWSRKRRMKGAEHREQVQIIHSLGSEKGRLSQGPGQTAKVVINRT